MFRSLTTFAALGVACALASAPAFAEDAPPPASDDLPIPTLKIDRIPANYSYELAVQFGAGDIAYWRKETAYWITFGIRGGWGKNFGPHRIGPDITAEVEGPFGVAFTAALEPRINWDYVSNGGLLLGAGVGPSAMYNAHADVTGPISAFSMAGSAVARIGWSETFSRVGRRLFVFVEPRLRYSPAGDAKEQPLSPGISLAVGSGRGY